VLEIWPASVPDLTSIEMAWSIIGRKLVTANVKTKVEHVCNELNDHDESSCTSSPSAEGGESTPFQITA
jgi:hypothetical protein